MAAAILVSEQNITREQAIVETEKMTKKNVQRLLTQDFTVNYYEIPLEVLSADGTFKAQTLNSDIPLQTFTKDGKQFVRWFVHPLHQSADFEKKYQSYQGPRGLFRGLLTSSRSLIVKDAQSEDYWSVKTSLAMAQGPFKEKKYNAVQAEYHFQMSQIINSDSYLRGRFFIEDSYIALHSESFDEGQTIRSLKPYKSGHVIQALATLLDPRIAIPLARKNGFGDDWQRFLNTLVMPDLGSTMGHLYEKYGLVHNSLHSQNVTVEFDSSGKFIGTKVRDPDFDVNIDRYAEVFGKDAAESYLAKSNIRNHQSLIIDFSALNGLPNFPFNRDTKRHIYRDLGLSFFNSFSKKVIELRQLPISNDELFSRLNDRIRVASFDDYDLRLSVSLTPGDFDLIIDRNAELTPHNSHNPKISTDGLEHAKSLLLQQIEGKNAGLSKYEVSQLEVAWTTLSQEYMADPKNSSLAKLFEENDSSKINKLIVLLNTFKSFEVKLFLKSALIQHPNVFRNNSTAFFFNGHYDEEMMKFYLGRATNDNLSSLWTFKTANKLLQYPQALLNRYFSLLPESQVKAILNKMAQDDQQKSAALKDRDMAKFRSKIEEALRVRRNLPSIKANACKNFYQ